jgi:hypothetical protein
MTSLKGIILACITLLITVGVVITYLSQQDRYALYAQEKGIFVFDRKTATLNFCDSQICQMIRPVLPAQEAEAFMAGMAGVPAQNSVVNGAFPISPPPMVPQGGVMQQPMAAQAMRQPSTMAQQPGIDSPLATSAKDHKKKKKKKSSKKDNLDKKSSSDNENTDKDSDENDSDTTNDDNGDEE